jgi:hypothetical protein
MGSTRQIHQDDWMAYFDRFTRRHLEHGAPEEATLELVSPSFGDQIESQGSRILGLSWDPKSQAFEVLLEGVDHMSFRPDEIWVVEEDDGLLSAIELVNADGDREILVLRRGASMMETPYPAS